MESQHFLFGGIAVELYNEMNFTEFSNKIKEGYLDFEVYKHTLGHHANSIIIIAQKWDSFAEISDEEYHSLISIKNSLPNIVLNYKTFPHGYVSLFKTTSQYGVFMQSEHTEITDTYPLTFDGFIQAKSRYKECIVMRRIFESAVENRKI